MYRLFKPSKSKHITMLFSTANLNKFRSELRRFYVSKIKMESVSEAAKAWSNPGISSIYEKTRPNYNSDAVEYLLEKVGALKAHQGSEPFTIVELGAGTGKFTRAVLRVFETREVKNFKIISTEPLQGMCEKFREMVPDVEILQRAASDLNGLLSNSADAILAAQCFHWFGADKKALDEIHRVLKPKATLGVIWNLPDRSVSWIEKIEEMLDPKYEDVKITRPALASTFAPLRSHGGFNNEGVNETTYRYDIKCDLVALVERYKGYSVVSDMTSQERELVLEAIRKEMKTNSDTKDKEMYTYEFYVKMHWFQKI